MDKGSKKIEIDCWDIPVNKHPGIFAHSLQDIIATILANKQDTMWLGADILKVAKTLRRKGVGPGELILVRANQLSETAIAVFAIWSIGSGVFLTDQDTSDHDCTIMCEKHQAAAWIDSSGQIELINKCGHFGFERKSATGVDLAFVDISLPHGRVFTHANLLSNARGISVALELVDVKTFFIYCKQIGATFIAYLALSIFNGCLPRFNKRNDSNGLKAFGKTCLLFDGFSSSEIGQNYINMEPNLETEHTLTITAGAPSLECLTSVQHSNSDYELMQTSLVQATPVCLLSMINNPMVNFNSDCLVFNPIHGLDARIMSKTRDGMLVETLPNHKGELYLRGEAVSRGSLVFNMKSCTSNISQADHWVATNCYYYYNNTGNFIMAERL